MSWGPENEAEAQARHVELILAGDSPQLDGWDGEHGRVGLVSRWDDLDDERAAAADRDRDEGRDGRRWS